MIRPGSCIRHLIRVKRDESILSRLRNPSQYSIPFARTERFKRSCFIYSASVVTVPDFPFSIGFGSVLEENLGFGFGFGFSATAVLIVNVRRDALQRP